MRASVMMQAVHKAKNLRFLLTGYEIIQPSHLGTNEKQVLSVKPYKKPKKLFATISV